MDRNYQMGWMPTPSPPLSSPFGGTSAYSYNTYPSVTSTVTTMAPDNISVSGIRHDAVASYNMQGYQTPSHTHDYSPYGYMDPRATPGPANIPQQSPTLYSSHNEYPPMGANSNRMMRNLAEKMRRDKLNTYINELAQLVPMVSNSPKRMDKTSVLRLATTYLRMYRVTEATRDQQHSTLPQNFNIPSWPQKILDDMDGVMLIVTSAGKIVFVSHNVEKVLGHTQTELLGHALSNITFPSDLPELKRCLTPDKDNDDSESEYEISEDCRVSSTENVTNASPRSSSACGASRTLSKSSTVSQFPDSCTSVERQRRSFCLRLRHRCLARSEQPQYESMHLSGFLRVPKKYTSQAQKKSRKCKGEMANTNSNEILLVAVMKPARELRLMSIVEASQEEYVTRHLYNGRIIYSDHRISQVSGYLPDEVNGLQAFCFMAKEEVHWVMIALRQMLWNREGFGKSCYRLKAKNGDFIYLVTHGYLEPCEDLQKSTFVCVNTLVSSEEGEREISNMKRKFQPIIEKKDEPSILAIAEKHTSFSDTDQDYELSTEDPIELKLALKAMVTDIPAPIEVVEDPEKCREKQFAKAKYISKTLPPAKLPNNQLITVIEDKANGGPKHDRLSPQTTPSTPSCSSLYTAATPSPQHPVSPSVSVSSPPMAASSRSSYQNRPSVLRIAPARQASVNAAGSTAADSYTISSTSDCENDDKTGVAMMSPSSICNGNATSENIQYSSFTSKCDFIKQECIKQETIEMNEFDDLEAQLAAAMQADPQQTAALTAAVAVVAAAERQSGVVRNSCEERVGVVVSRTAVKRRLDCDDTSSFASSIVPMKRTALSEMANQVHVDCNIKVHQKHLGGDITSIMSPNQISSYNGRTNSYPVGDPNDMHETVLPQIDPFTQLSNIEICETTTRFVNIDSFEPKPEPEEVLQLLDNENLKHRHIELESKMHRQGAQIHDIEGDLGKVPFTSKQRGLQTDLTQLKEQHVKQKKLLMTLQQDHHSLQHQHCNTDSMNMTNMHQNVGV